MKHETSKERRIELERFVRDLQGLVSEAVNSADPVGLLEDEAPPDEYSSEVDRIVARIVGIRKKPTDHQVEEACEAVFREQFGDETSMKVGSFEAVANFIVARWEDLKPPHPFDA